MNLLELIEALEGAGIVITNMEEVESELERMGVDSEMFIPQEWDDGEKEIDPDNESQCVECLHDFDECTCE